ncbi:MAG: AlkZ family DNA glycosylase [Clostridiaceae bacterium]|nr:AlkZ family DNA glycosylase [Clostridiaceae bacterium]
MEILKITKRQACRFILSHQGLGAVSEFQGKKGVLDFIKRVGSIQYDALNVVGYNSDLVLQSRIPDFKPEMLQELLYKERTLIDQLDKEMCIYSVEDWPYFRRHRASALKRYGGSSEPIIPFLEEVRQAIKERGSLSSIDLNLKEIVDWAWSPTRVSRAALESMYLWGELIIHHKVNTRKVYDFSDRHIPKALLETEEPNDTVEAYQDWYVLRRIGAVGLLWNKAGDAWLRMPDIKSRERNSTLNRLLKQEKIVEVQIEDVKYPFYMKSQDISSLKEILKVENKNQRGFIIAPLDNMLWDRGLVKELFDFYYRWEVYKPLSQRTYGYYVLPILYGDKFVARFEPGKDKDNNTLIIKNWWWESDVVQSERMQLALSICFKQFKNYLGADNLHIHEDIVNREELHWLTLI